MNIHYQIPMLYIVPSPSRHLHVSVPFKAVRFQLFRESDTRNLKSLDTWVLVNNFVKTRKYSRMYKITNMNTNFSRII